MHLWPLLDMERIKLSSGQTRKILLCKAFLGQPRFLLLDNPHIGLDDESRDLFNKYLEQLVTHFDQQIILAGHFRSLPRCINQQLELENGHLKYLGKFSGRIQAHSKSKAIPGNELVSAFKNPPSAQFKILLKFDQLDIQYNAKGIIKRLNWKVEKGDKWVVQGPNGSGKSTLISLIYGDHPQAYSNKIILFDRQRGTGESIWEIKHKIGFTSPELHSYFNYNHRAEDVVLSGLSDTFFVQSRPPASVRLCQELFRYFDISDIMQQQRSNKQEKTN